MSGARILSEEPQAAMLAAELLDALWWQYDAPAVHVRLDRLGLVEDLDRARFGIARIVTSEDGTYQPHPDGEPHLIAVEGVPEPHLGWREIFDFVAFKSDAPGTWWRRTGYADVLGADEIDRLAFLRQPVIVHETPLDWLRAGCRGCVILDWTFNPKTAFALSTEIHCATPALATALRKRFAEVSRPHQAVRVLVQEARNAA